MSEIVASRIPTPARSLSLDVDAYRTLAFAKIEDDTVWTREWICIGVDEDIPDVGDLLPFTAGDHAVHVQRLASGRLAGRFNLAQHGGCRVVPLQCRQGAKTSCSFTSCGHSRDRAPLQAAEAKTPSPEMYQYLGLRPERLLGVRVATDGPLIFVHLDPAGDAFNRVEVVATPHRESSARRDDGWLELAGNWKHVGQRIATGAKLAGATAASATFESTESIEEEGGGAPICATWRFPNLIVLSAGASQCVIVLQPIALQRTLCRLTLYGPQPLARWRALLERRASAIDIPADSHRWLETTLAARVVQRTTPSPLTGDDT
ncbi:hypothetical protein [Pararobbsia alpina]|uniref:Rieske domain-containing protein n=1 Tax=Pararobbsia alpina TaxID=621374 RepID=A0A6S7BIQ7_9BURK|nr:hypothetical protein [Pararobbsia alpina]CAB3801555.1 hypothetical protein LMG28138_05028 [Pararobbsia alpina]